MRLKFKIYLALGLVFLFSAGLAYADENQPAFPDSQTEETEQHVDKNTQNPNDAQSQNGDATGKQNQDNNVNTNNLHANTVYKDLIGEYIYIYLYDSDEMLEGRLEKDEQDYILVSSEKIYKKAIKHIMLDDLKDRIALL